MEELHFRSASELGRMLRAREIGSAELTEHFISRIETHNPRINAVVATDRHKLKHHDGEIERVMRPMVERIQV